MVAFGEDLVRFHPLNTAMTFDKVLARFRQDFVARKIDLPDKNEFEDDKDELRCATHHAICRWLNQQVDVSPCYVAGTTPELYSRDCSHYIGDFDNTIMGFAEAILANALHYELCGWLASATQK